MDKFKEILKKGLLYVGGLALIAIGINFSKLARLGISPVSSVPRACELIWGFSLGVTTWIIYGILLVLQILVLRKKFRWVNLLCLPVTVVFGWLVDLFGIDPNAFGHLLLRTGLPTPPNYFVSLLYLVVSLILIGVGVFLYIKPGWVALPAEGLAAAISQVSGKKFGDCKTAVDCGLILIALILQLIFLGGIHSFTGDRVVVREGTILAAVLVGQIVKFLAKIFGKKAKKAA